MPIPAAAIWTSGKLLPPCRERYKNSAPSRFFLPGLANEDVQALERVSGTEGGLLRPADVAAVRKRLQALAGKIEAAARKVAAIDPEAILISDDPEKQPACRAPQSHPPPAQAQNALGLSPSGPRKGPTHCFWKRRCSTAWMPASPGPILNCRTTSSKLAKATNTTKVEDALLQARRYLPDRTPSAVKDALRSFCASPELLELVRGF